MKRIEKIVNNVLEITVEDIEKANAIIEEQKLYTNPFKMATANWQQQLANHNQAILDAILYLKAIIEAGENIKKP